MFIKLLKTKDFSKFISNQPQLENIVRNLLIRRTSNQKFPQQPTSHAQVNLSSLFSKPQPSINTTQQSKQGVCWFKRKKIGYGWTPASREGWLVTIIYLGVIFWLIKPLIYQQMEQEIFWDWFMPKFLLTTAILIFICYRTGQKMNNLSAS
ncbi:MAG: hypothetical protein WC575_04390 [Patescibacteria group bacterium]